jgi:hypothetical protein
MDIRADGETFLEAYRRVGETPFKQRLHPEPSHAAA